MDAEKRVFLAYFKAESIRHSLFVVEEFSLIDTHYQFGIDWKYCETELLTKTEMESLIQIAKDILNNSSIVQWSGATKIEDSDKPKQKHTVENV